VRLLATMSNHGADGDAVSPADAEVREPVNDLSKCLSRTLEHAAERRVDVVVEVVELRERLASRDRELATLREWHDRELATLREWHDRELATLREWHDRELTTLREWRERESATLRESCASSQRVIAHLNQCIAELTAQLAAERTARDRVHVHSTFTSASTSSTAWDASPDRSSSRGRPPLPPVRML
jgi:chromosome segregation ATPase